jgi:hypothetical protein
MNDGNAAMQLFSAFGTKETVKETLHNGVPAVESEEMLSSDSTTIHLESGRIITLMKIGFLQMTVQLK